MYPASLIHRFMWITYEIEKTNMLSFGERVTGWAITRSHLIGFGIDEADDSLLIAN